MHVRSLILLLKQPANQFVHRIEQNYNVLFRIEIEEWMRHEWHVRMICRLGYFVLEHFVRRSEVILHRSATCADLIEGGALA